MFRKEALRDKITGSVTLIRFGAAQSRESNLAQWSGPHAQLVALDPSTLDFYQYYLSADSNGIWPVCADVETEIPANERVDAVDEVILRGALHFPPRVAVAGHEHADETRTFSYVDRYVTAVKGGRVVCAGDHRAVAARCVVLVRKRDSASDANFGRFVNNRLMPALADARVVVELRAQVFGSRQHRESGVPAAGRKRSSTTGYHASIVVGARDDDALAAVLAGMAKSAAEQREHCVAIHAYRAERTQINALDGRSLVPLIGQAVKPRLDPVRRVLPPAPPRARLRKGASPFVTAGLFPAGGKSPEDIVVDAAGRLLYGVSDGRILRLEPETCRHEIVGNTHGRPLGLEILPDGNLIVCDPYRGLLHLDLQSGKTSVLVDRVHDVPLRFCSNATAARDGTIWFTQASTRFDYAYYEGAMLEHRGSGRLLRRDPDGKVTVVLDALYFANGITLDEDEASVIFAETDGYCLRRYWIEGSRKGRTDTLIDNLPGFPDNISRMSRGRFWVAIPSVRNESLDRLGASPAIVRKLLWQWPALMNTKRVQTAWAMAFDNEGRIVADLQASVPEFHSATGVVESKGRLYMASLRSDSLLALDLSHLALSERENSRLGQA
jgi:sugar lactone lactonase YvrE